MFGFLAGIIAMHVYIEVTTCTKVNQYQYNNIIHLTSDSLVIDHDLIIVECD